MNRVTRFLLDCAELEITGAWPTRAINALAAARIPIDGFSMEDEMCCRIRVLRRDLKRAQALILRCQCDSRVLRRSGLRAKFYGLKKRGILLAGLAGVLVIALLLPQFVWTLEVTGNTGVPDAEILRALESLGIGFGTYGPSIDSQTVKNHMLALVPELEWIAINRSGGRAVVEVQEKVVSPPILDGHAITNIVAARTGIITNAEVYAGKSLVKPGQTVLQGELLVSGVAQWTNRTQTSHAMAEIYARTWHHQIAVIPQVATVRRDVAEVQVTKTLILGKKRIKISGKSSISVDHCAKIIDESALTLPGGIVLPVRLETVRCTVYEEAQQPLSPHTAFAILAQGAEQRIRTRLLAGEILKTGCTQRAEAGLYSYTAVAECSEQIAREVPVETDEGEP